MRSSPRKQRRALTFQWESFPLARMVYWSTSKTVSKIAEGWNLLMDTPENRSDVARLRQRIAQEYEAAMRGLSGLASGTAKHEFIARRIEQIGICHGSLRHLAASRKHCHRDREGEE